MLINAIILVEEREKKKACQLRPKRCVIGAALFYDNATHETSKTMKICRHNT